jgi:hypothetical protein
MYMYGQGFAGHLPIIDSWFRAVALRGVRELDINMFYATPKPGLSGSLLDLTFLETLKVYCCRFPGAAAAAPCSQDAGPVQRDHVAAFSAGDAVELHGP